MSVEQIALEIHYATLVRAAPEPVYDAFATSQGLDGWFTTGARIDARPGGDIHFRWFEWGAERMTAEEPGKVVEARRPERLVFEWHPAGPDHPTTVELDFEPDEEGTIIRLREFGYRDTAADRRALMECAVGWGEALTCWKFFVEHELRY